MRFPPWLLATALLAACSSDGASEVSSTAVDVGEETSTASAPDADPQPVDTAPNAPDARAPGEDTAERSPDPGPPVVDARSPVDTGPIVTRPPVVETYGAFIGDWTMSPGAETTRCVLKRLDNPSEVFVTAIHTKLDPGSHHLVVYRSASQEEKPEPFKCTPFTETLDGKTIPLLITQIPEETLQLPAGVAFKFEPNQMVRIEAHYLNYYAEDITAHAQIDFDTIAVEHVDAEANMLFYGTPDFSLEPGQAHQTPWNFLDVWAGKKVFALTGHTHALGTGVEVSFAKDAADEGTPIYPLDQPFQWDEAPVIVYDPPLEFAEGEGFRYRCSWFNSTDKKVGFGESATKEMCFFWAYYYPSEGYRMCVNPGSYFPGLNQACCPDLGPLCDQIKDFL